MTTDARETFHPKSRAAWRRWLEKNHLRGEGVWVIFNKKSAGLVRLEYAMPSKRRCASAGSTAS